MDRIGDRFEVQALAGQGGMGRVFRARDRDGSIVAVKVLRLDGAPDALVRFRRETDALARLSHPAIVRHVAHGSDGNVPFLAMQWVDGEELRVRLKRDTTLAVPDLVVLAGRVAGALAHVHEKGIVHRDVKPSNIILANNDIAHAMLIDFGLARGAVADEDDELTQAGMLVGTPAFMAPEQVRDGSATNAVDVFTLGSVMYQCLAGTSPFTAGSATAILARVLFGDAVPIARAAPATPEFLVDLVTAMLRKNPAERPTMRDVERALVDRSPARIQTTERLSTREQRVAGVIVAGGPTGDEDATLRRIVGQDASELGTIALRWNAEITRLPTGAILAVLTAAEDATDLAVRTASCALALHRDMPGTPIRLAMGRALTGKGLAIGEAVDRVIALAPAEDGVRIDDVAAGLLASRFVLRADRNGPILDSAASREPVRTLLGKPTPCVGRDAELATLAGAIAQSASESVARVVVVTGPAGAGKSRLRKELLARLPEDPWIAHGDAMSAGTPFGLASQIVRRVCGIDAGDDPGEISRKLAARTGDAATFLGEMIGARSSDLDVQVRAARSDPRLMADRMQGAFVDFVDRECASKAVVIVLEDLQWGDQPSVAAIDAALRRFEDRPLAVVAFARPEVASIFPNLWAARSALPLPLAPLPKKAAARLVRVVLPDGSDAMIADLVEKAAGNVFLLEELVRAEAEGRREVPATVVAVVQSRLGALDADARRTLRAASILGDVFSTEGVRRLLGNEPGVGSRLDDLVRGEVLGRTADGDYAFRHGLVREGAYAMLTDEDRSLGHRLAAEWLEASGAMPLVVAGHFERAGDHARAAIAFLQAAEHALEASDLTRALEHADRCAALGAAGALLGAANGVRAHAHLWRGETEKMESAAARAIDLLPAQDARFIDALALLAIAKQRLGHTEELTGVADRLSAMLSSATGDRRAALARAGGRVASLLFFAGKQDRAAAMLDAAEHAAEGGGVDIAARIHQARAPHARQAGRPEAALRHAEAAAAAYRVAGDLRNACMMDGIRGFALSELGAYGDAEIVLGRALHDAERLGLATVAASARSNLGIVHLRLGRPADAEASVRAAIAAFESNDKRHEGGSRAYLAMILRERGELEEAEREARRALVALESALALRPLAAAVLATILLASGRSNEAVEVARDAWSANVNIEEGDAYARLALARSLFATGAKSDALAVLVTARQRILDRASTIETPALRASYLAMPEHGTTLALADDWSR